MKSSRKTEPRSDSDVIFSLTPPKNLADKRGEVHPASMMISLNFTLQAIHEAHPNIRFTPPIEVRFVQDKNGSGDLYLTNIRFKEQK